MALIATPGEHLCVYFLLLLLCLRKYQKYNLSLDSVISNCAHDKFWSYWKIMKFMKKIMKAKEEERRISRIIQKKKLFIYLFKEKRQNFQASEMHDLKIIFK